MSSQSTRDLVDPELLALLDMVPTAALSDELLPTLRQPGRLPFPPADEAGQAVKLERKSVPGPKDAPDVAILIYSPPENTAPRPCIFHIHGGGYVMGDAAAQEPVHRTMAAKLGCVIVTVDYRLAPETRFPGAVEDCYAALSWLFANAEALGVDPKRVGVMGESAGGGLAASLALLVRDRGEHRLAFQHLIYPMIDDRTCTAADPHPHVGEYIWTTHNNAYGWSALLGVEPGSDGVSPYAAAARAEDVSRLPPTFISTGALDLFLEEDMEYARRLMRAGVPVELHVYAGGFHGFDFHPTADVSMRARRDSRAALARALKA
jgi:triacylglycerol lipase